MYLLLGIASEVLPIVQAQDLYSDTEDGFKWVEGSRAVTSTHPFLIRSRGRASGRIRSASQPELTHPLELCYALSQNRSTMRTRYYLLIGIAGLLCYSGLIEPSWIVERHRDVTIDGFPVAELSIVHIADIHTTGFGRRERETIRRIDRIDPDYVLITGDLLKSTSKLPHAISFLSQLRSRYGVYLVLGNADGVLESAIRWHKTPKETLNYRILMNESADCGAFTLVGIDDPVTGREDLAKAFKGVPPTKPVFVMSHFHPDGLIAEIEDMGAAMMFSGHTHGGHIGIAHLVGLIPYAYRSRYISGLYSLNHCYLSVTKGVGTNIFPFRLLCRPEIVVFRIRGG